MSTKDNNQTSKRLYEKPRLRSIELVADEVLAVGCKVRSGQSAFRNRRPTCLRPRQCYANGS